MFKAIVKINEARRCKAERNALTLMKRSILGVSNPVTQLRQHCPSDRYAGNVLLPVRTA